jgi:hypothetical protein
MKYFIMTTSNHNGTTSAVLAKTNDGTILGIPPDPMNVDYLEYVKWLFDGNTAEEWQPNAVEPETTQPDMEEEI